MGNAVMRPLPSAVTNFKSNHTAANDTIHTIDGAEISITNSTFLGLTIRVGSGNWSTTFGSPQAVVVRTALVDPHSGTPDVISQPQYRRNNDTLDGNTQQPSTSDLATPLSQSLAAQQGETRKNQLASSVNHVDGSALPAGHHDRDTSNHHDNPSNSRVNGSGRSSSGSRGVFETIVSCSETNSTSAVLVLPALTQHVVSGAGTLLLFECTLILRSGERQSTPVAWGYLRIGGENGTEAAQLLSRSAKAVAIGFPPNSRLPETHAYVPEAALHASKSVWGASASLPIKLFAYSSPNRRQSDRTEAKFDAAQDLSLPDVFMQYRHRKRTRLAATTPLTLSILPFRAAIPLKRTVAFQAEKELTLQYATPTTTVVSDTNAADRDRVVSIELNASTYVWLPTDEFVRVLETNAATDTIDPTTTGKDIPDSGMADTVPNSVLEQSQGKSSGNSLNADMSDAAEVAVESYLKSARVWRASTQACVAPNSLLRHSLPTSSYGANVIAWSPNGAMLAVGCTPDENLASVRVFALISGLQFVELAMLPRKGNKHTAATTTVSTVGQIRMQPEGNHPQQHTHVHAPFAQGNDYEDERPYHAGYITALDWSSDSRLLISSSTDGCALVWQVEQESRETSSYTIRMLSQLLHRSHRTIGVTSAAFVPTLTRNQAGNEECYAVTGATDGKVRLWSVFGDHDASFIDEIQWSSANSATATENPSETQTATARENTVSGHTAPYQQQQPQPSRVPALPPLRLTTTRSLTGGSTVMDTTMAEHTDQQYAHSGAITAIITTVLPPSQSSTTTATTVYLATGDEAGNVFVWHATFPAPTHTGSPEPRASVSNESTKQTRSSRPYFTCLRYFTLPPPLPVASLAFRFGRGNVLGQPPSLVVYGYTDGDRAMARVYSLIDGTVEQQATFGGATGAALGVALPHAVTVSPDSRSFVAISPGRDALRVWNSTPPVGSFSQDRNALQQWSQNAAIVRIAELQNIPIALCLPPTAERAVAAWHPHAQLIAIACSRKQGDESNTDAGSGFRIIFATMRS